MTARSLSRAIAVSFLVSFDDFDLLLIGPSDLNR